MSSNGTYIYAANKLGSCKHDHVSGNNLPQIESNKMLTSFQHGIVYYLCSVGTVHEIYIVLKCHCHSPNLT